MPPRVLVDATAVPADRGGVGRYVDGLLAALGGDAGIDGSLAIACQRTDAERYAKLAPSATIVAGPSAIAHRPARLAWEQTGLPLIAQQVGADVLHCPHYTMPLHAPMPVVVTVHDATWFSEPQLHAGARGGFYRSATKTSLRRATRCIVPSEATRAELVRLLGADAARLDVARHGVDATVFHPPSEEQRRRIASRLGLRGRPYIAFLGVLERRKNVPNLIRGYAMACADLAEPPALVLAGSSGWDDEVDAAVTQIAPPLRVIRPGFLRIADLGSFFGGALVVAHPSQAEGFGLPVLEAMACGAPVLTTRALSLPEVGGDAVEYCEADAEAIAAGLRRLLDDPERRERLSAAGRRRAAEFTWASSAAAHLAAYDAASAHARA